MGIMSDPVSRASVIGAGAMGTLCALLLAERGIRVTLWGRSRELVETLARTRVNDRYLPGTRLPDSVRPTCEDSLAFDGAELIVAAVPCQFLRSVWQRLAQRVPPGVPVVSVVKGLEVDTLLRPTQIIEQVSPGVETACLSGPCIAPEVAERLPTSVVVAAGREELGALVQCSFSTGYFRVYTSDDLLGVELAAAAKNVIAIATGICDGMGAGANAKAALVTRGLVELTRLGVAMGAKAETFRGLAGVGDLVTTCVSPVGRNRSAGERIGRGMSAAEAAAATHSVIEGIDTTRSVVALARRLKVELPICEAVADILFAGVRPAEAIERLMSRPLRSE